jgi:hypothetical protein
VTESELVEAISKNVEATYLAIGRATPGAEVAHGEGFDVCRCEFDHPVGNFALARSVDEEAAKLLLDLAKRRKGFNVYALPAALAGSASERLLDAGFRRSYELSVLACRCEGSPGSGHWRIVEGAPERLAVAQFMTRQFFTRTDPAIRERIARATVGAGLELRVFRLGEEEPGAAMICREAGVFGIYNLCIEGRRRGSGIGSAAVRNLQSEAFDAGVPAALQCDASLEAWYVELGFDRVASIEVFAAGGR